VLLLLVSTRGWAQEVNPAEARRPQDEESSSEEDEQKVVPDRVPSWLMEPTVVEGSRLPFLWEEDRIGSYGQPRWTARRLFPTTRVYVRPEGELELEYWTRVKVPDEGPTEVETQYEVEVGLPGRFQLDLYMVNSKKGGEGELALAEQKTELRYALADWGEIPANPTLYVEWVSRDERPDKAEFKLLLGDELARSWHWGSNLVFEHEVSGERENEYGLTLGIAHTVVDGKLSLGAEMKAALVDTAADRGDYEKELEIGPSLRWMPMPAMHIDFAPLIGIGADSRAADIFLVVGWEF
jgi:hypothetical protein